MSWLKSESDEKPTLESVRKEIEQHNEDESITLDTCRALAELWEQLCLSDQPNIRQWLDDQEHYLKLECAMWWGRCEFEVDREKRTFWVKARDGRAMELVSGKIKIESEN